MRISAVIPTFERHELLVAAIESVRRQTLEVAEIVVVVDGERPDPDTLAALDRIDDPRLVVVRGGRRLGNARARNLGIDAASGDWIALLDDDDEWSPVKLERQREAILADRARGGRDAPDTDPDGVTGAATGTATGTMTGPPIASCRLHARIGARRFLWPRLPPRAGEPIARYLFCRRWPLTGDRLVQTSTLVAPRALFLATPFRDGRRFVDQDWLLRAAAEQRARLVFPAGPEPLVVWDLAPGRRRVSHYRSWRWCIGWARRRAALLGPRAHAAFLLTLASASAADAGEARAFWPLLREAFVAGRPNPAELATHALNFALSRPLRDRIAARVNRALGS